MLPKPWRNNRYKYAMVCIDTFTKKADMEPMKDKEAKTCNTAIEKIRSQKVSSIRILNEFTPQAFTK